MKRTRSSSYGWLIAGGCFTLLLGVSLRAAPLKFESTPFREGFESGETVWKQSEPVSGCRVSFQRRQSKVYREGNGGLQLQVETTASPGKYRLEYPIDPGRGVEDITARSWVKADRQGVTLGMRLVLPNQKDPRTGESMTINIDGESTTEEGVWQQLKCVVTDAELKSQIRILRKYLEADLDDIDKTGWYVDRVLLSFDRLQGGTECFIDDLVISPHISMPKEMISLVSYATRDDSLEIGVEIPRAEVRLDRLYLDGKPTFLRMVPHHGESAEFLSELGFNPVWIRDTGNRELIKQLARKGIWSMGTPPETEATGDESSSAEQVSMLPFDASLDPIVFWMLGNGITAAERKKLIAWADQIKDADKRLNRPLLADITGLERIYSRYIPLMGLSRPVLNSSLGYLDYRDWLIERQRLSRPGTFGWTWIQTEPVSEIVRSRSSMVQSPINVHYEQMRLQVYSSLASGCRSLGYWSTRSLEEDAPGSLERQLSIKQLNLELLLLGDLLATGELQGQLPVKTKTPLKSGDRIEAAIFKTSLGILLLPIWYDANGQFVPGQMVGENVEILIKGGIPEASTIWEISTTGEDNLVRKQVAGGTLVTLNRLNTVSAIFVPHDERAMDRIRRLRMRTAALSAATAVELARVKLDMTRAIDRELASLGVDQPVGALKLREANVWLTQASEQLRNRNYHSARLNAEYACQALRILQREHWNFAVGSRKHPVSSPHLISFESLPDHWRLVARIGRLASGDVPNRLSSGTFEREDEFHDEWMVNPESIDGVVALADLHRTELGEAGTHLRLSAGAANLRDVPRYINESLISVVSPSVPVERGDLVHVTGRVRVKTAPIRTLDGLKISDSVGGESLALSFRNAGEWEEFEMFRTPGEAMEFRIQCALHGLGEVWIDDLSVRVLPMENVPEPVVQTGAKEEEADPYWKKFTRLKGFAPQKLLPEGAKLPELDFFREGGDREKVQQGSARD